MLRHDRARLITAAAGVAVATLLLLMQMGFQASLYDAAVRLLATFRGDLFLIHPTTTASFRPESFPRARAWQALADPAVLLAAPVQIGMATWRNPNAPGGADWEERRAIQVVGLDPELGAVAYPGLAGALEALRAPDKLVFDRLSIPSFGDVPALLAERGPFEATLGHRAVRVVGLVSIGASFGADGHVVMSAENFRRAFPARPPGVVDLVALRLRPGEEIAAAQVRLRALLPRDVLVLTHAELVAREKAFWQSESPIGVIFGFGVVMGLLVGLVVVYQILFSAVASHIPEFATMRAMGYAQGQLVRVVLAAALLLAVLGFGPGLLGAAWLYGQVSEATGLPLATTAERAALVFLLIFTICGAAGAMATFKLRQADPAALF